MTTKVIITYPEPGHAPSVNVMAWPASGPAQGYILATLKPGESTAQYVHSGQRIMIEEVQ